MSEKVRSFISVDLTDPVLLEKLTELQKSLAETGADLKLVELENIHLTLRFLGEISSSTVEAVKNELNDISFQPFNIRLEGLGAFPSLNRINVIWVGVTDGYPVLRQISEKIEEGLRKIGFPPDPKGFSPHLTIARIRTGRNKDKLASFITESRNTQFGSMRVDSVRLKKSVLTPKGPIYSTLFEVKASE